MSSKNNKRSSEDNVLSAKKDVQYYSELLETSDPVLNALRLLNKQREINLPNIKESCVFELQRFIRSRGSIDNATGVVHLDLLSLSESNNASTIEQMKAAQRLIDKVCGVESFESLNDLIQQAVIEISPSDDLSEVIEQCLSISAVGMKKTLGIL